ncbi:uncharacterized protein J7T54_002606 [Emericellopsis cladophorae]|uniref:Uncharacterized protein n=1 Tax=Emericellopsis cladophorae TaxID=2686198 RepID=A0A9P9XX49_9HYPO|nr:uncharacterized protein J7T54_002606 [Emericellopsis cladophorae]KAI6778964.1 hypothetical protein J7T54_002606 [Emericellopsis cladophorae]
MVIGLLAIAAIPTVTGVAQAVSAQQRQQESCKQQLKFMLTAMLPVEGELREAAFCVLVDGQLYLDFPDQPVPGHKFCGYYFKYPGPEQHQGLVSTICDDPPMLNWIFVDGSTGAVRFGGKKATEGHVIGPWGWSADEHFLTLQQDPASFRARKGEDGRWSVYWDPEGEGAGLPLRLRRRMMQQGVESRYVKG